MYYTECLKKRSYLQFWGAEEHFFEKNLIIVILFPFNKQSAILLLQSVQIFFFIHRKSLYTNILNFQKLDSNKRLKNYILERKYLFRGRKCWRESKLLENNNFTLKIFLIIPLFISYFLGASRRHKIRHYKREERRDIMRIDNVYHLTLLHVTFPTFSYDKSLPLDFKI